MNPSPKITDKQRARWRAVEDHIHFESAHNLDSLVRTFGDRPRWHNKPSGEVFRGHDKIRRFYGDLFTGFPDFSLNIRNRWAADDAIIVDGTYGGTHQGTWMGIAPTGRTVSVDFCAVFTFTKDGLIKSETAYYDRFTILEQLGIVHRES